MSLRLNFPIPRAVTRRAPSDYRPPLTREEVEVRKALQRPPRSQSMPKKEGS